MSLFGGTKRLYKKEEKLRRKLDKLDYDSKKYLKIDNKRLKVMDKIFRKEDYKLHRREHGWYLPNDD